MRVSSASGNLSLLLVRPYELRGRENVAFHVLQQNVLRCAIQVRQFRVERIQLVEVPMPPYRRARPVVACAFPVV